MIRSPDYTPQQYAAALAVLLAGRTDRTVTSRVACAARRLAAQNAESSRRYADAYAAITDAPRPPTGAPCTTIRTRILPP